MLRVESKCTREFPDRTDYSVWLSTGDGAEEDQIEVGVTKDEFDKLSAGETARFRMELECPV